MVMNGDEWLSGLWALEPRVASVLVNKNVSPHIFFDFRDKPRVDFLLWLTAESDIG